MKVRARSSAALRAFALGVAFARAGAPVWEIDVITCPGCYPQMLPPGTGFSKPIGTDNGRFRKLAKDVLLGLFAIGTSCCAKGYIGGFNVAAAGMLED